MNFSKIIFAVIFLPPLSFSASYYQHLELHDHLLQNYFREFRPVLHIEDTLDITCSGSIVSVLDFNEIDGILKTTISLKFTWSDRMLTWNASSFNGIDTTRIPITDVWHPPLILTNAVDNILLNVSQNVGQSLRLSNEGKVELHMGTVIKTTCDANIMYYPFDNHHCQINMITSEYSNDEVSLEIANDVVFPSIEDSNNQWVIYLLQNTNMLVEFHGINVSCITLNVKLARRPEFLILNLFLPLFMMQIVNIMVFCLPSVTGERISFSITILLTNVFYWVIIVNKMPPTSRPMPYVSILNVCSLLANSLVTMTCIFISRLYHCKADKEIPKYLKTIVNFTSIIPFCKVHVVEQISNEPNENIGLTSIGDFFSRSNKVKDRNVVIRRISVQEIQEKENTTAMNTSAIFGQLEKIDKQEGKLSEQASREEYTKTLTWEIVGKAIDKVCFVTFMSSFIFGNITLWCIVDPLELFR